MIFESLHLNLLKHNSIYNSPLLTAVPPFITPLLPAIDCLSSIETKKHSLKAIQLKLPYCYTDPYSYKMACGGRKCD